MCGNFNTFFYTKISDAHLDSWKSAKRVTLLQLNGDTELKRILDAELRSDRITKNKKTTEKEKGDQEQSSDAESGTSRRKNAAGLMWRGITGVEDNRQRDGMSRRPQCARSPRKMERETGQNHKPQQGER